MKAAMDDAGKAARVARLRIEAAQQTHADDLVSIEEPLEIRVEERPLSVTMRTPGDDEALAAGFLFGESVISNRASIASIRHWGSPNVIRIALRDGERIDFQRLQRHFYSTSSCGVCGKTSIDALRVHARRIEASWRTDPRTVEGLPATMRRGQRSFEATGSLHAAALFTPEGDMLAIGEDVGRHNAVDKVIGAQFLFGRTPLSDHILFVSGRTSFEILQKAIVAGIPIVAAIGAPTSLAVDLAREFGVTLIGFVREAGFNVYAGEERLSSR
jgi:FdhD protein